MRAAKTVNYCNCLPSYNYTAADGQSYSVTNGTCIRTTAAELPWCFVVEDTCITPVLHRNGLGRNDSGWDTCLNTGVHALPVPVSVFRKKQPIPPHTYCCACACVWLAGVQHVRTAWMKREALSHVA